MIDDSEFLNDSLFCEWTYIINLDNEQFEVYRGFNKDPSAKVVMQKAKLKIMKVTGVLH